MDYYLVKEFVEKLLECNNCTGCEEGCAVCGQWMDEDEESQEYLEASRIVFSCNWENEKCIKECKKLIAQHKYTPQVCCSCGVYPASGNGLCFSCFCEITGVDFDSDFL